ncbi:MAG: CdaR family protein [Candidatus Eremiobacterota bacterium]
MTNFLKKDINLKILSLVFAIFLWVYVYYKDTPFQENLAVTSFVVPIEVKGLASDLTVVEMQDDVFVKVRGNKDIISDMKAGGVRASVDLSNKSTGTYRVLVQASSLVEVVSVEPQAVDIKIDKLIEKTVDITLEFEGKPKSGYVVSGENVKILPESVRVKGPEGTMVNVNKVLVKPDISNADLSLKKMEVPLITDRQGNLISGLTVKPSEVEVRIEIIPDRIYRTVPIIPSITGTLPEGYVIKEISLRHSTATIEITSEEGKSVESVRTSPVDIDKKTDDFAAKVWIVPVKGINIINNTVQIVIRIDKKVASIKTPATKTN